MNKGNPLVCSGPSYSRRRYAMDTSVALHSELLAEGTLPVLRHIESSRMPLRHRRLF